MTSTYFRAEIGPYWLFLPETAELTVQVTRAPPGAYQIALTRWIALVGRFQFGIQLDANKSPSDLKPFLEQMTRREVETPALSINHIEGVTFGDYEADHTWIDWWFKKGDVMIQICLQSFSTSPSETTAWEAAEHAEIVNSLKYSPDWSSELPPI